MTREQLQNRAIRLHELYIRSLRLVRGANDEERRILQRVLAERAADCRSAVSAYRMAVPL